MARARKYKSVKPINDPTASLSTRVQRAIDRNAVSSFRSLLGQWLDERARPGWPTTLFAQIIKAHGIDSIAGDGLGRVVLAAMRERKEKMTPYQASVIMGEAIEKGALHLVPSLHELGGKIDLLNGEEAARAKKMLAIHVGKGHWPDVEQIAPGFFEVEDNVSLAAAFFFDPPPSKHIKHSNHHAMRHFHIENMKKMTWHPETASLFGEALGHAARNLNQISHLQDNHESNGCLINLITLGWLDTNKAREIASGLVHEARITKLVAHLEQVVIASNTTKAPTPGARPRIRI